MSAPMEPPTQFSPPLGGHAPPLQCNRLLSGSAGDQTNTDYCGRPGAWHILWTVDCENGIACQEHYDEARRRWVYYAAHQYRTDCSMPGAVYDRERNVCWVPEDGNELSLVAAKELTDA